MRKLFLTVPAFLVFTRIAAQDVEDLCAEFGQAAYDGNAERISEFLLEKVGFDVNCRDENVHLDNYPIVRNANALHRALQCCGENAAEIVHLLVDNGRIRIDDQEDAHGLTALMLAAWHGRQEIATFLLDRGANINAKTRKNGRTALMFASWNNKPEMVRFLLTKGAFLNDKDIFDADAFIFACSYGNVEAAEVLLEAGADIDDLAPDEGDTAVIAAAGNAQVEIARSLLDRGADVNVVSRSGESALMRAASNGKVETVRFLLDRGAHTNAKNSRGLTALKLAEIRNHINVIEVLLDGGAQRE